jgi:translocation protein SEC72
MLFKYFIPFVLIPFKALFKLNRRADAISRYTMAASVAIQRPPWEANQIMREELSTVISNRSAAYFEACDYIGALVDAETVISLRRNWSKGHFRKAKALLGLGKWDEARDAVRLGLQYEPANKVSHVGRLRSKLTSSKFTRN